jgi:hypothetical protein
VILAINLLLILAAIWILYIKTRNSPVKEHLIIALSVKIFAGIALGLLYFRYYKFGDTIVFSEVATAIVDLYGDSITGFLRFLFNDHEVILANTYQVLNEPRSAFFIKILSVFYLLTNSNYWITSIYFSLISFLGSWILTDALIANNKKMKLSSILAMFYFPTFVFWTSGILKEAIAWFCLATMISYIITYLHKRNLSLKQILFSLFLLYILWSIKYHYAAVLLLCAGPLLTFYLLQKYLKRNIEYYLVVIAAFILICGLLMSIHPNFYPKRIFSVILENHQMIKHLTEPGHSIQFIYAKDPYVHFFINIPVSLFGGLFMPLLWQGTNILVYITGLVNAILLLLFIFKVIDLFRSKKRKLSIVEVSMGLYIIILAILLAYSAPNFGTLERYKIGYIPFFTLWILYDNRVTDRIFKYIKQ